MDNTVPVSHDEPEKHRKPTLSEWIDEHDEHQTDVRLRKYDVYGHTKPLDTAWRILYAVVWPILIAGMIAYTVKITIKLEDQRLHPPTMVSYDNDAVVYLPQITVCNWNQEERSASSCPYCDIILVGCDALQENGSDPEDCKSQWKFITIHSEEYGLFKCYQFNTDPHSVVTGTNTGYDSSQALIFALPPIASVPPGAVLRSGLIISFNLPGEDPDLYNAGFNAPTGYDSFFAMREIREWEDSESHNDDEAHFKRSYSVKNYILELPILSMVHEGENYELIGASFAMESQRFQKIVASPNYRLTNWWADFAAVSGVILNLDLVKLASSGIIFAAAWRKRRIAHLREHFM